MKSFSGAAARNGTPRRSPLRRWDFALLCVAAAVLLLLGRAGTGLMERARAGAGDVIAPIMELVSEPVGLVSAAVNDLGNFFDVYEENVRLREQNARLSEWHQMALNLTRENSALRELSKYRPGNDFASVATRVVGDSTGIFVRSVLANAGGEAGLSKGDAVIDARGLIGRVVEAGHRSSRVLLITDLNSRVPVVVQRNGALAILAGDNSATPVLKFRSLRARLRPGDRIVTSGHGDMFPPDLAVGEVAEIDDGEVRIRPLADLDRLDYVRVLTAYERDVAGRDRVGTGTVRRTGHSGRR